VFTVATDLTPAMLRRARDKARAGHHLVVMDGHSLAIPDGAFDAVALHLILAVIPDPARCLAEAVRVLRPGGRISILDKFVPDGHAPSMGRRLLNGITALVATDITRRLDVIITESGAAVERTGREPAMRGLFTIATLVAVKGKPADSLAAGGGTSGSVRS
jgi:ubiquinone/menaquinone biosynthesis C-methylase UbiE